MLPKSPCDLGSSTITPLFDENDFIRLVLCSRVELMVASCHWLGTSEP